MDYSLEEEAVEHLFEKVKRFILPSEENNYKSRFLQSNFLLYCVVLLLALRITATLVSINFPKNIFFADITKFALENSVNQTRQAIGLQSLTENDKLDQAAQAKAENMVKNNYFDHNSPSGITPWFWFSQAGYNYKYAGENLAIGFYDSEEVYQAWLNSPSHKANIENPNYTEVGTAVLSGFGQNNSIVVVQEFASPAPAKIVVAKNNNIKAPVVAVAKPTVKSTPPPSIVKTHPVPNVITSGPAATTQTTVVNNQKQQSNNQPVAYNNGGEVLSKSTVSQDSLSSSGTNSSINNLPSKLLNSIIYNYNDILKSAVYGVSLIVIGILLTLIFLNLNTNFKRELVYRAVIIVVLLLAATAVNKDLIISLIPHQVLI